MKVIHFIVPLLLAFLHQGAAWQLKISKDGKEGCLQLGRDLTKDGKAITVYGGCTGPITKFKWTGQQIEADGLVKGICLTLRKDVKPAVITAELCKNEPRQQWIQIPGTNSYKNGAENKLQLQIKNAPRGRNLSSWGDWVALAALVGFAFTLLWIGLG